MYNLLQMMSPPANRFKLCWMNYNIFVWLHTYIYTKRPGATTTLTLLLTISKPLGPLAAILGGNVYVVNGDRLPVLGITKQ